MSRRAILTCSAVLALAAGTAVPAAQAAPAPAAAPRAAAWCAASALSLSPGGSDGAAGTITNVLVVRNAGRTACVIRGYPVLSRFAADGRRYATATARTLSPAARTVVLAAGARASFLWSYTDVPSGSSQTCGSSPVMGVTLPGAARTHYLATGAVPVCSTVVRVSALASGVLPLG